MLINKKAISSYILILLIITSILSLLLFLILDGIYGASHKDCSKVDFQITDVCKNLGSVSFSIKNNKNTKLEISFNGIENSGNEILAKENKILRFNYKGDSVDLVPVIRDRGKVYFCSGKTKSQNIKIISKKC